MIEEKKDHYAAANFAEGPLSAGRGCRPHRRQQAAGTGGKIPQIHGLAGFQNAIPTGNWMYPVTQVALAAGFDTLKTADHPEFTPQQVASERQTWINAWQRAVSHKPVGWLLPGLFAATFCVVVALAAFSGAVVQRAPGDLAGGRFQR